MKLFDNPIFLTQKRLVHRGGVLAAILIAALVGASLLAGLASYLADPQYFNNFNSAPAAGKTFYGWTIGVEILVLVVGGFGRVSRVLTEDRKAGLWDSNRLTPLKPAQIIAGYWFGPALREFYMAATLAGFGLIIVLAGRLPLTLWLGTQILIASTALFFGLLGILVGMALQRSQGLLILPALLLAWPFAFIGPGRILSNFLLPIFGIIHLFHPRPDYYDSDGNNWVDLPEIFGLPVYPILLTVALQTIIGFFIWRALVRKTANPFQPLLLRWEAVAIFTILVATQQSLLWDLWRGRFPHSLRANNDEPLLAIVHGGTIVLGILLLSLTSPLPERVRVDALRLGFKNLGVVLGRSSVFVALILTAIASAAMLTQFLFSLVDSFRILAVTTINVAEIFLIFALLLEFCRLRHKRRALGFVALWLFILCVIPFILAGIFSNVTFTYLSLLTPGFVALGDPNDPERLLLLFPLLAHFGIIVALFLGWRQEWRKLLSKAA